MNDNFPSKNRNHKDKKPQLESSGMDIPDYAIERMAKCLLPLMRSYFEKGEGEAEVEAWENESNRRLAG